MTERQKSLWVTTESLDQLMKDQSLQRTLDPADMARAVLFFASDECLGDQPELRLRRRVALVPRHRSPNLSIPPCGGN